MGKKLKIAIACGGTGGHIFPGLATGHELLERGHDVTLWMAGKDIESDAVKGWTGRIITIPSEGFQFGFSVRSVLTIFRLYKAYRLALAPMRETRPDVLLAMGSYASFGPVRAARKLGIPYVLHEANLLPGRAVSLLTRKAHTVAVSFEKSRFYLKHGNIEATGMPLRKELQRASLLPRRERAAGDPLRILVMGGSRGAQVLNEVVPSAIAAAAEKKAIAIEVEHIAGAQNFDEVEAIYKAAGIKAHVHHFVQDMENIYLNVDLALCRSGAATCAELAVFGVPALFIPYPFASRNHQMGNARALQDSGAADVVAQEDLTATWLRDYLISVSEKPERLERMVIAMKKRAQINASGRLADLLERVAEA
ncbi:MAG: undecaprenyldiphospho-muramoylpentapeptide beta-N-acetylglucosaminyltransferase [Kiritimatiellales bacterium]|nr:undecaprenyldiphospho-muramoylpentapeptide beta-N-acetylglucosaminyltransferase [Kiritimatiellales bacterium]